MLTYDCTVLHCTVDANFYCNRGFLCAVPVLIIQTKRFPAVIGIGTFHDYFSAYNRYSYSLKPVRIPFCGSLRSWNIAYKKPWPWSTRPDIPGTGISHSWFICDSWHHACPLLPKYSYLRWGRSEPGGVEGAGTILRNSLASIDSYINHFR
jgi:hypothetical protein